MNIVIILIDSARADYFPPYNRSIKTTPFLESLGGEAVVMENCIAPSGWTLPSCSSIFTGVYPFSKDDFSGEGMIKNFPTIAEVLAGNGYYCAAISDNAYAGPGTGLDKGFHKFVYFNKENIKKVISPKALLKYMGQFSLFPPRKPNTNYLMIEQAKLLIREYKRKPFFLYLHLSVHHPYRPQLRFLKYFTDIKKLPKYRIYLPDDFLRIMEHDKVAEHKTLIQLLYKGEILYTDSCIKNLWQFMEKERLKDETILIITADHGDYLGEGGLLSHQFGLYEPLLRVPLIIYLPDSLYKNKDVRYYGLVQTTDIFPTLCNVLKLSHQCSMHFDGMSFYNDNSINSSRDFAISARDNVPAMAEKINRRYPRLNIEPYNHIIVAYRKARRKFIWSSKGLHEAYDLSCDPGEQQNLYKVGSSYHDWVELLQDEATIWIEKIKMREFKEKEVVRNFDEAMREQLRFLGYME